MPHLRRPLSVAGLALSLAALASCTTLPASNSASAAEPALTLHTWLLPACPSSPDAGRVAIAPAIDGLVGIAVDSIIDWMAGALAQAAKADRDGRATAGIS